MGIKIQYKCQKQPDGIAQALILAEEFLNGSPLCLILGDNLFYGDNLSSKLKEVNSAREKGTLFAYQVNDPCRYGIIEFNEELTVISIEEKPIYPKSNFAVTGIYFYENSVVNIAKILSPQRGELEITDINKALLNEGRLKVKLLKRGMAWLDTGTVESLHDAGTFIKTIETRQGLKIGCPEEISWKLGYINKDELGILASKHSKSEYGNYLMKLLKKNMKIKKCKHNKGGFFEGPFVISPEIYSDNRGSFFESWNSRQFNNVIKKIIFSCKIINPLPTKES